MSDFEQSITVNAAADRVFDFLSNVGNFPLYMPTVRAATPLPGERVRMEGDRGGGQSYQSEGQLRLHPDSHRMEWSSDRGGYNGTLSVEGQNATCVVRIQLHFDRIPEHLGGNAGAIIHADLVRTLESIQNVVERKGRKLGAN